MSEPVHVILNDENSRAVRWLFQNLQPTPTMTGIVNRAVQFYLEAMADRPSAYHQPFRDWQRTRRATLRVLP